MGKKTSAPANAFGAGKELIGTKYRGEEIVSATRQYMTTESGNTVPRQGNRVEFDVDEGRSYRKISKGPSEETEGDKL